MVVVFPAPFGPMSAKISPSPISKETLSAASTFVYCLESSFTSRMLPNEIPLFQMYILQDNYITNFPKSQCFINTYYFYWVGLLFVKSDCDCCILSYCFDKNCYDCRTAQIGSALIVAIC